MESHLRLNNRLIELSELLETKRIPALSSEKATIPLIYLPTGKR